MLKNTCTAIKKFIEDNDNQMWFFIALLLAAVLFFAEKVVKIYSNAFGTLTFPTTATPSTLVAIRAEWGQIGDFFGGVLNPLFGFASLFALLVTIAYQARSLRVSSEELKLSREELSKSSTALASQNKAIELQSFEQTFFSWLNTYRDLLNDISGTIPTKIPTGITQGRTHLYELWYSRLSAEAISNEIFQHNGYGERTNILTEHLGLNTNLPEDLNGAGYSKKIEIVAKVNQDKISDRVQNAWNSLYVNNEYKLDSLFRTAYKLLTWIDSQKNSRLSDEDKWLYVSIFRSQLSWIELVYFYYNGLTVTGGKFKPIIEKYALFDNLNLDSDICIKITTQNHISEKIYSKEAFNSDLARKTEVSLNTPLQITP